MQLNAYLHFTGQCAAAFKFYEKCLGGSIVMSVTYGNSPAAEHTPANWHDKILHTTLMVGAAVLMGSDGPPDYTEKPLGFSVSIGVDDPAKAEQLFQALAEGGNVKLPIQETFWARRFGMLVDRFGVPWMVNCGKTG